MVTRRDASLWSAWCRFVSVQLGTSSAPSAQDERHRQERDRRHKTAQSLRADDRVAQGIERPRKGDRKQRDRDAASQALRLEQHGPRRREQERVVATKLWAQ